MDKSSVSYGERLLPRNLDEYAKSEPKRLFASVSRGSTDLEQGFRDLTTQSMAHCVDVLAYLLEELYGQRSTFEAICYLGPPDLRGATMFFATVKCGYKIIFLSPKLPHLTIVALLNETACSKRALSVPKAIQRSTGRSSNHPPLLRINRLALVLRKTNNNRSVSRLQGTPEPIQMTHGAFSILDRERLLPRIPNRQNVDFSIWDFNNRPANRVSRFYTPFPFFHLSGFLSTVVNPLFTKAIPILGPALALPSPAILKAALPQQQPHCRAIYIPPALAEALLHDPSALTLFENLDFIAYTGGPFSPAAGETLSAITILRPLFGFTEAFQVPQLAPQDPRSHYAYMEWHPSFKVEMQPIDVGGEAGAVHELVLFTDETARKMSTLNHNFPHAHGEWRSKDLFLRHPSPGKEALWKYYGRKDDIVMLSTGAKFNPVPMELRVAGHPKVAGALVVGRGRP
ncbi:MAG: hypothetical protein Q9181_006744 [Wetmoreana brouardii]